MSKKKQPLSLSVHTFEAPRMYFARVKWAEFETCVWQAVFKSDFKFHVDLIFPPLVVLVAQICPEGTSFDCALKKTKSKGGTVAQEGKQVVPTHLLPNKRNIKSSLESSRYVLTCYAAFCFIVLRGKLHRVHLGEHIIIQLQIHSTLL